MKLNVSAAKAFLSDQMDWYYAYVLKRIPNRRESALDLGTIWHVLLEQLHKTGSREKAKELARAEVEAICLAVPPEQNDWTGEFHRDAEHLMDIFDAYEERVAFDKTLMIEEALEMTLPNSVHVLVGRPDRVVEHNGKFWHVQNRTLSDRTVMPVYLAAAERDLHELAYAAMIAKHFNTGLAQYGGTFMNIARKVSKKKLAEDPQAAFVQEFIPIDPRQVETALFDLVQIADDMQEIMDGVRSPVQNRDTDKGRFGNRLSNYFEVKMGRASIHDDTLFKHAESRYDREPATVAE
jgi:hypothetical protein